MKKKLFCFFNLLRLSGIGPCCVLWPNWSLGDGPRCSNWSGWACSSGPDASSHQPCSSTSWWEPVRLCYRRRPSVLKTNIKILHVHLSPSAAVSASGSGNSMSGPPANGLYRTMPQPQQQQQPPPPSSGLPSSSFYGSGSVPNTSQSSSLFSHNSAAPPPSSSLGFSSTGGSLGMGLGSALGGFGSSGQWLNDRFLIFIFCIVWLLLFIQWNIFKITN